MKFLIDCHEFDKSHQGTTVYIKNLFIRLAKERDDIDFYFCARDIDNLKLVFGNNHKYIRLNSKNILSRILFEYPKIIKNHKINYCHFNYIMPLLKSNHCKYFVTIHDVLFLDFKKLFSWSYILPRAILFKISAKNSTHVFTVSNYSKGRIASRLKIKKNKITILSNGINHTKKFKANQRDLPLDIEYNKYILSVGRIETRKNQELLLDIYLENKYYEKNIKLVFVGSSAFCSKEFLNKRNNLKKSGLDKHVIFLENISEQLLFTLYKYCLVHIYISKCEGFGIPPLESISLGSITICSNTTAMSDFDFFRELHVNPEDKETIKLLIEKILKGDTQELLNDDLQKIKSIIDVKYNWNQTVKKLNNLIKT